MACSLAARFDQRSVCQEYYSGVIPAILRVVAFLGAMNLVANIQVVEDINQAICSTTSSITYKPWVHELVSVSVHLQSSSESENHHN